VTKTPAAVLKEAAAAAKTARIEGDPRAKPYKHAINYRLDKTAKSPKGDYNKRYNALVELVGALNGKLWHYATSSWETTSHLSSQVILDHLAAPLDPAIDVLVVTPIGGSIVFGDPKKLNS